MLSQFWLESVTLLGLCTSVSTVTLGQSSESSKFAGSRMSSWVQSSYCVVSRYRSPRASFVPLSVISGVAEASVLMPLLTSLVFFVTIFLVFLLRGKHQTERIDVFVPLELFFFTFLLDFIVRPSN
uniref:Secreted protein n=1 Tax=Ixodes ricinus TaxID=34613 RepID=A0A6B0UQY5_IXORI